MHVCMNECMYRPLETECEKIRISNLIRPFPFAFIIRPSYRDSVISRSDICPFFFFLFPFQSFLGSVLFCFSSRFAFKFCA